MPLGPPTAATKYQPPTPVMSWVERKRLTVALAAGGNKRLALLHGPAGYGKSTLAAQWVAELAHADFAVAWFSLDRDDNNTIWFMSHLIESLLKAGVELDPHLLQLLQERPVDAEKYVVPSIINALAECRRPTVIAVDDWHRILDPRTRAVLERLLDEGPESLRFVITSRTRNGLPLGRLRVRDQLVEVDATSLRFDHRESWQLLVGINRLELTSDDIDSVLEATDGWAAALQLTSLSLRGQSDVSGIVRKISGRHQAIGEYLAENVLDTLEPEVLDFLLSTSITQRTCADLAATLSGVRRGQAMLEEVQARDLFLQPLDVEGSWYRYHHLFQEYLRKRLERDEPDRVPELHRKAAHWYAEHNHTSEAVDHALTAGDIEFAVDVVESDAMLKVEHSQMSTLLAMVKKLPASRVGPRPRLQMAIAWANCLLHFPNESRIALEQAEILLGPDCELGTEEQDELRLEALVVRRCLEMYADQIAPTNDLRVLVLESTKPLRPWIVSVAANIATYAELQKGNFAAALATQDAARVAHDQTSGPFSEVYGHCFAGLAAFAQLDIVTAQRHLEDALELGRRSAGRQSHAARLAGGLLGEMLYLRGAFDEAEKLLVEAQELGAHAGVADFMMSTYSTLARLRASRGDMEGSIQAIESGERIAAALDLPRLSTRLMADRAGLGFPWKDDGRTAFDYPHITDAADDSRELATLASMLLSGQPGSASTTATLAAKLLERRREHGNKYEILCARLALAEALQGAGHQEEAEQELKDVLVICHGLDLPLVLVERTQNCRGLLRSLSAAVESGAWVPKDAAAIHAFIGRILDLGKFSGQTGSGAIAGANSFMEPVTAALVPGRRDAPTLSEREQGILILVEGGLSNREIAQSLHIGINTVKWYLKSLFVTFGVSNRQQCVDAARELQLLNQ